MLLHDQELRLGWGKAVTIPQVPLYGAVGPAGSAPAPAKGAVGCRAVILPSAQSTTIVVPDGVAPVHQ